MKDQIGDPTNASSSSNVWDQRHTSAKHQTLKKGCIGFQPNKHRHSTNPTTQHGTAHAGTGFPLKYLPPKKALSTPWRQYVYDAILYTNALFFFFFKQDDGGKGLLVCFQNMSVFRGVLAFIHEMGHASRAQQRELNVLTSNILDLCCLSWRIQLSAHPESLEKKTTLNDLVLHSQTQGATGQREYKRCPTG